MGKLFVRGGFSDRNGTMQCSRDMQTNELSAVTRNDLFNFVMSLLDDLLASADKLFDYENKTRFENFASREIISNLFHEKLIFGMNYSFCDDVEKKTMSLFRNGDYDDVLTAVEYLVNEVLSYYQPGATFSNDDEIKEAVDGLNHVFESDYVGYRYFNKQITPITNESEIQSIVDSSSFDNDVGDHIAKAQKLLSDKVSPDYENSIKESVTAVETIANKIVGPGLTLTQALVELKKKGCIKDDNLFNSLRSLYLYTCDANGIRHAGNMGAPHSSFEDARLMLVVCSAFVNYLKQYIH